MGRSPIDESGCLVQTGTRSSLFITFEGAEGSGKTTQSEMLANHLLRSGHPAKCAREPGGTKLGDRLRKILLERSGAKIYSRAEVLLFNASRAALVHEVLKPALDAGKIVVCDRYTDSSLAYQGSRHDGLSFDEVAQVNEFATGSLRPDITFLLDIEPELGLERVNANYDRMFYGLAYTRFEAERIEFHRRVVEHYRYLAKSEPERWRIVGASGRAESVAKRVKEIVREEFTRRGMVPKW